MTVDGETRATNRRPIPDSAWPIATALAAGILAAPGLAAPLSGSLYDAGITSSAGVWLLHGLVPYRDFWLLYGPLPGAVAALVTAVFGTDPLVLRLAGLVVLMASAAIAGSIVARHAPRSLSAIVSVLALSMPVFWTGLDLSSWNLAILFVLVAVDLSARSGPRRWIWVGLAVGLAGLARPDVGLYAMLAIVLAHRTLRPLAGAALVVGPVIALFLSQIPIGTILEQVLWFPAVIHTRFRAIPAPGLIPTVTSIPAWALFWLPLVVLAATIVRAVVRRSAPPRDVGVLLVFAVLWRIQTLVRPDAFHLAETVGPATLLVAPLVGRLDSPGRRFAAAGLFAVCLGVALAPIAWLAGPADPYDDALRSATAMVRAATGPDEPVYIGEVRNRYTWTNPLLAYAMVDRPPGVRATMDNPGVTNTDPVQRQMVADLRARKVRFLILDVRSADCRETSNESRTPGSTILDAAIGQDYRVVADMGALVIMLRRDVPSTIVQTTIWVDPTPPAPDGALICDRSTSDP